MDQYRNLSYTKWDCKYHVVFISKCRREVLYGSLRLGGNDATGEKPLRQCSIRSGGCHVVVGNAKR